MDKLGVVLEDEKVKTGSEGALCPTCGTKLSKPQWCPKCGTEPFEKRPEPPKK